MRGIAVKLLLGIALASLNFSVDLLFIFDFRWSDRLPLGFFLLLRQKANVEGVKRGWLTFVLVDNDLFSEKGPFRFIQHQI